MICVVIKIDADNTTYNFSHATMRRTSVSDLIEFTYKIGTNEWKWNFYDVVVKSCRRHAIKTETYRRRICGESCMGIPCIIFLSMWIFSCRTLHRFLFFHFLVSKHSFTIQAFAGRNKRTIITFESSRLLRMQTVNQRNRWRSGNLCCVRNVFVRYTRRCLYSFHWG